MFIIDGTTSTTHARSIGRLFNDELSGKAPYETRELAPEVGAAGVDVARMTGSKFSQIKSKHGPATNRQGPNSVFDGDLVTDYGTFADKIVAPALEPGPAPIEISQSMMNPYSVKLDGVLPYRVGLTEIGAPTNKVRIEPRYNWVQSVTSLTNIWTITGAYPRE